MKTTVKITAIALMVIIAGCNGLGEKKATAPPAAKESNQDNLLLTVDFKQGKPLRYKFVSHRDIEVEWAPKQKSSGKTSGKTKKGSEELEMVFSYTPVEVNPYGISTIKAECESVRVSRRGELTTGKKEATSYLRGHTFILKVDPQGNIADYSQLKELAYKIRKKAFRSDTSRGRIKEPDMTGDFIATQWFLWDAVSSIKNPAEGVQEGQSWQSRLSVPLPMIVKAVRDVTYRLAEIQQSEKGQLAVIRSSYSSADSVAGNWPLPYSGSFRMSGQFGFFRKYKVLSLKGSGKQIFNIDEGRIEKDIQNYSVQMEAIFPIPLGNGQKYNPRINIRQRITMELLNSRVSPKK